MSQFEPGPQREGGVASARKRIYLIINHTQRRSMKERKEFESQLLQIKTVSVRGANKRKKGTHIVGSI